VTPSLAFVTAYEGHNRSDLPEIHSQLVITVPSLALIPRSDRSKLVMRAETNRF
jgi:hypothetical protein